MNETNNRSIQSKGKIKIYNYKYVIKPKEKDLLNLFYYLDNRSFNNHPQIISEDAKNYIYNYLNDIEEPLNQKSVDMAILLSNLHNKTSYFKNINQNIKEAIIDNLKTTIKYGEEYYNKIFNQNENTTIMRPSLQILFIYRNKIQTLFNYLEHEIENYKEQINLLDKERVVYCHNNLQIEHYNVQNNCFISWDKYTIDTPVLDLKNLYQNDWYKYDFSIFFNKYMSLFPLNDDEKTLFSILTSIPENIELDLNEMNNTIKITKLIKYIEKTENLLMPYNSKKDKV